MPTLDGGAPHAPLTFAAEVVDRTAGEGGGFGEDALPDVVLGPPKGAGDGAGSRDVYSLGIGGSITLAFSAPCPNGPGPDLIVFENPFRIGPNSVFTEAGAVGVATDATDGLDVTAFATFPCAPDDPAPNGCAGMSPVYAGSAAPDISPQDPETAGGDAFDFDALNDAAIAEEGVLFVRITDVGGIRGDNGASGFDLDAIACVHGDAP